METIMEEIRRKKREYGYTNEDMAEKSGLPLSTVRKVLGGTTPSPQLKTVEALRAVFAEESPAGQSSPSAYPPVRPGECLGEAPLSYAAVPYPPSVRYPRQGSYTLEDYLALPDDQRVELIDGVFYDMSAPTIPHQVIGADIHARLLSFIRSRKGSCLPLIAPTDVQLDRDNRTILQPDVMVVCDRSILTPARVFGAPDFVVEVLSPGTRAKDIFIKTQKYKNAGVKEYWMVDLKRESVTKMLFLPPSEEEPEGDVITQVYSFDEAVPVSIFQEECRIDFREIADSYAFLYENGEK